MFSLSIIVGSTSLALLFADKDKAYAADNTISAAAQGQTFTIDDEFGHKLTLTRSNIHAWLLEDMNRSALAHQERTLHEAKIRANIQKAAQSNPGLREAFRPPSTPMLVPGMPGIR